MGLEASPEPVVRLALDELLEARRSLRGRRAQVDEPLTSIVGEQVRIVEACIERLERRLGIRDAGPIYVPPELEPRVEHELEMLSAMAERIHGKGMGAALREARKRQAARKAPGPLRMLLGRVLVRLLPPRPT